MRRFAPLMVCLLVPISLGAQAGKAGAGPLARAIAVKPPFPAAPGREVRIALVIGNSAYHGSFLKNPRNDARGMKEALEGCRFEVTLLMDGSKRQMEDAISTFGNRLQGGAVGLFYFAGHGLQVKGDNFLIPIEARLEKEEDVPYEGVNVGRLLDRMEAARNSLNILILDACRTNPFGRGWYRGQGERGLAQLNAPMGAFIAYSTAPGKTAADGTGDHGIYTEALLAQLQVPGMELDKVFNKVGVRVLEASHRNQIPWVSSTPHEEFYFRPQREPDGAGRSGEARPGPEGPGALDPIARPQEAARKDASPKEPPGAPERDRPSQVGLRRKGAESGTLKAKVENDRERKGGIRLEERKEEPRPEPAGREVSTLEGAGQEMSRLSREREDAMEAIRAQKDDALRGLDIEFQGIAKRMGVPRDEFETTVQFQRRMQEAGALPARARKERAALEARFALASAEKAQSIDRQVATLKARTFPVSYPVALGTYDPDKGRFPVRIAPDADRSFLGSLALEPASARELKSRKDLLRAEGDATVGALQPVPTRIVDPVWGALPLEGVEAKVIPRVGALVRIDLGDGVQLDLVGVPPGAFAMGEANDPHNVTISQAFWLGRFAVTQAQWRAVMGTAPSCFKGPERPVEQVSWRDCQLFLERLNRKGHGRFRLPTEAEWEYACRAGTKEERHGDLDAIAWHEGNAGKGTHPVGRKQPNAWGLYDMTGNVSQWCQDRYADYSAVAAVDPAGPAHGTYRVCRGGSWGSNQTLVRSAERAAYGPNDRYNGLGFRIMMILP